MIGQGALLWAFWSSGVCDGAILPRDFYIDVLLLKGDVPRPAKSIVTGFSNSLQRVVAHFELATKAWSWDLETWPGPFCLGCPTQTQNQVCVASMKFHSHGHHPKQVWACYLQIVPGLRPFFPHALSSFTHTSSPPALWPHCNPTSPQKRPNFLDKHFDISIYFTHDLLYT